MKFTTKAVTAPVEILANDHYVAMPFDFSSFNGLAVDGVLKAGTIIPEDGDKAAGIVLYDVNLAENPNGALVLHGFIKIEKMPNEPSAEAIAALKQITFI